MISACKNWLTFWDGATQWELKEEFSREVQARLEQGEKEYKGSIHKKTIKQVAIDLQEECLDIAAYAMFIFDKSTSWVVRGIARRCSQYAYHVWRKAKEIERLG